MSDQLVTLSVLTSALAKFHAEIIAPDVRRIVQESEARLRNEMQGFHDSILKKLGDLETESAAIKIGLKGVEDRLEKVEGRLDKVGQRLDSVKNDLRQLDERLSRVEKRIDEIAQPQPGLRAEVQQLKTSIESLQGRIDALERRAKR
jgi:chromosome segregation ATPase